MIDQEDSNVFMAEALVLIVFGQPAKVHLGCYVHGPVEEDDEGEDQQQAGQVVFNLVVLLDRGQQGEGEDVEGVDCEDEGGCGHFVLHDHDLLEFLHAQGGLLCSPEFEVVDLLAEVEADEPEEDDEGDLDHDVEDEILAQAHPHSDAIEVEDVVVGREDVVAVDVLQGVHVVDGHGARVAQEVPDKEDNLGDLHRLEANHLVEYHRE